MNKFFKWLLIYNFLDFAFENEETCYTLDFGHLRISVHFKLTYLRPYPYDETIFQTTNAHYNSCNTKNCVNNRNNYWINFIICKTNSIHAQLVSVQICRDFSFPMAFEIWRRSLLEVLKNDFHNLHDCKFYVLMFKYVLVFPYLSFWAMSWSKSSSPLWWLILSPYT